ncbi:hypothetical protein RvY_06715-3 [Ramazzottius varieornatus]|uniref:Uncharacterized protein n=1 Tax=Ramazzottius varieornatus TaxID=947166 RepID=A0A1D1V931_RAMVA|nr:hypothetical protein RvY_06715-3 [Ramazzottius varieornatus]
MDVRRWLFIPLVVVLPTMVISRCQILAVCQLFIRTSDTRDITKFSVLCSCSPGRKRDRLHPGSMSGASNISRLPTQPRQCLVDTKDDTKISCFCQLFIRTNCAISCQG